MNPSWILHGEDFVGDCLVTQVLKLLATREVWVIIMKGEHGQQIVAQLELYRAHTPCAAA